MAAASAEAIWIWPGVYLLLSLNSPVFVESLSPFNTTPPQFVELSIRQLEARRVHYILWEPYLDSPTSPQHPETYHLTPFRDFMKNNYQKVWTFSDEEEIWERK